MFDGNLDRKRNRVLPDAERDGSETGFENGLENGSDETGENRQPKGDLPEGAVRLARLHAAPVIFAALTFLLCSASIPFLQNETAALVMLGVCFVYIVFVIRTPQTVLIPLTLTVLFSVVFGFQVGATFAVLACGAEAGAFCRFYEKLRTSLFFASFAVALGIGFATGDWKNAGLSLVLIPSAILLGEATKRKARRVNAILFCEFGLLFSALVVLLYALCLSVGSLSREAISAAVESYRADLLSALFEARDLFLDGMRASTSTGNVNDTLETLVSDDVIRQAVDILFGLFPSLFIGFFSLAAYLAQFLMIAHCISAQKFELMPSVARVFSVGMISTGLFLVAAIVALFGSFSSFFVTVMQNLYFILLPAFVLLGIRGLLARFMKASVSGRIFGLLALLAFFCCMSAGALSLLAVWGAIDNILFFIGLQMMKQRHSDPPDGTGNP